jgi:Flp pilus assembly protein TadG
VTKEKFWLRGFGLRFEFAIVIAKSHNIMRLLSLLFRLGKDENGTVLVQFTVYIIAIMGMIGLALDGGRFFLVHNSLQDLADAAALAGAVDLDGQSGARTRATTDAENMATNNPPRWYDASVGSGGSTSITTAFYSAISTSGDTAATGDANAHYIKVTTSISGIVPTFLRAVGAISANSTQATAMAYAGYQTCAPVQAFICVGDLPVTTAGTQYLSYCKACGGNGNWGVLDLPTGVSSYRDYFAQVSPSACNSNTVHQHPGNGKSKALVDGVNVRFDQPQATSGDLSTSAPEVIDGITSRGGGNSCSGQGSAVPTNFDPTIPPYTGGTNGCVGAGSCPMPRDVAIANETTATVNYGAGVSSTDLATYWNNHFGTSTLPTGVNSRYTAYLCELGAGSFASVSGCNQMSSTWSTDSVEPHAPQCSAKTSDYTRRIIHVAIDDAGCPHGNSGGPLTFTRYADFFITEDAVFDSSGGGGQPIIYAELVGIYTANSKGSILHQVVQLVR